MEYLKTAADFFAGIGLVSLGLHKQGWNVVYALDHSETKFRLYNNHFRSNHYSLQDIKEVTATSVPRVTLAHASFPCTDISVAGSRGGLQSGQSSTFWEFARILREMLHFKKLPPFVMLENVEGLLSSGDGSDLKAILKTLNKIGYSVDLLLIDAACFVPQSRVRLFIIGNTLGSEKATDISGEFSRSHSSNARPLKVKNFIQNNSDINWSIRDLPMLPQCALKLDDIIDKEATWWSCERSEYLLSQMFSRHKEIIHQMMQHNYWSYGTVFRRMRVRDGIKQSTAELRTDGIAGCLRTPKGGSARQILIRAGKGQFHARLINETESARLMGAEDYALPVNVSLNEVLFGFGDAVCVPVISWIIKYYLDPMFNELVIQQENIIKRMGDLSVALPGFV
jgi:DNA (cytosine-5)-methyltransferase 1